MESILIKNFSYKYLSKELNESLQCYITLIKMGYLNEIIVFSRKTSKYDYQFER